MDRDRSVLTEYCKDREASEKIIKSKTLSGMEGMPTSRDDPSQVDEEELGSLL
jgi:hypothetical protein